jgi:hypothetical protein
MGSLLPYVAGIGCSLCYGTATVLEQIAARRQKSIISVHFTGLVNLFRKLPYATGILLDLIGWVLFIFAARTLPLFLVLSFAASSLVITILIAHTYLHIKTRPLVRFAVLILILGIVLLGITAQPSAAQPVSNLFKLSVEVAILPILIIGLEFLKSIKKHYSSILLSSLAGLSFGATGLLARTIHFSFSFGQLFHISTVCLVGYGILGSIFFAAALQRENINIVNGVLYSSELTVPSLLGILFLGDRARGDLWPILLIGFICVIISTPIIALKAGSESAA